MVLVVMTGLRFDFYSYLCLFFLIDVINSELKKMFTVFGGYAYILEYIFLKPIPGVSHVTYLCADV